MAEAKSPRPPQRRTLKPAPLPSTYVESSRSKSEVQFALPADQPQVGKLSPRAPGFTKSAYRKSRNGSYQHLCCLPAVTGARRSAAFQMKSPAGLFELES
ncbi:hypothetical protein J3459_012070 [Metarhizium acridum]|uniref:uncharacterized protein n=1 Tax=Metarhizium acridum TaxID=92637 RepID=UPI001C6C9155|nr:hypothetical protein J3458_009485 [Metarhizium acridum]KAG8418757.1 hypothetical protein J3459_012070 [Metarhizium acridum]